MIWKNGEKKMSMNSKFTLKELQKLDPDWYGDDPAPPQDKALKSARDFMDSMFVAAVPNGGVQLEWNISGLDVSVFFDADGEIEDVSVSNDDPMVKEDGEKYSTMEYADGTVEIAFHPDSNELTGVSVIFLENLGLKQ